MKILVILFLLFTLTNGADDGMQNNPCFSEQRRNVKIANCQSRHGLTFIPQDLDTDIEELYFQNQLLDSLQENNFKRYDLLTALYLTNNEIKNVNEGCFKNLSHLKILDLSKNIIRELPSIFQDTPHIEEIYLNNNEITILPDIVFSNLQHLKKLDLQNNKIRLIENNSFFNLPAIYEINLNNNMIEKISENIIQNLVNLKLLDLEKNPWNCDKSTCKFREYSLEKNWKISMPHCDTPENVRGKIWQELKNDTVLIIANKTEIVEEQNVTFTCEYLACIPFKLTWRTKRGEVLTNHTVQTLDNKFLATLQLHNVAKSNEMVYVCSVEDCRNCKEGEVYLRVNDKIIEKTNSISILIGILIVIIIIVIVAVIYMAYVFHPNLFGRGSNEDLTMTDIDQLAVPLRKTEKSQEDQEQNTSVELPTRTNKEDENDKLDS